jgi:hypothetical protein
MTNMTVSPLLMSGDPLREWVINLKWSLAGDCWCHNGIHATDLTDTTPATKILSHDLLAVLMKAVSAHTNSSYQRNARSLLQDHINGVDGTELISQGKGFEMFQLRIKSGFSRGLGTEAISHLTEYVSATQASLESIGSFFDQMQQLYNQVQLTQGCSIGDIAQKSFILEGLRRGAYHEVLGPWVKKILIGQGRLKLETSTMSSLQHGATDLIAASTFYQGNILLPGKMPRPTGAAARAATDATSTKKPSSDFRIESIVKTFRLGLALNQTQTSWLRTQYKCIHCLSNAHPLEDCRAAGLKWKITALPTASPAPGGKPAGRIADANPAGSHEQAPPPTPQPELPPQTDPDPKARAATNSGRGEDESETDESDEAFTYLGYESDPYLLSALLQAAARTAEDARRIRFLDSPAPTTVAKIGKKESRWVNAGTTLLAVGNDKLDNHSSVYHARKAAPSTSTNTTRTSYPRTVCPDFGATSIMGPHHDMFIDYVDVRGKGLVVRLGNEAKTIPIVGRGTLCINLMGHSVAYAHALHVPDLSVILLSSRVHRRITPGCSFVADHSGCFLTFPEFTITVDDTEDCIIPCGLVPPNTSFDFDSRLYITSNSSAQDLRRCTIIQLERPHNARLVALRKSRAHVDPADLVSPVISTHAPTLKQTTSPLPTRPVYSVPDSGCKAIERVSSYDLKQMFGCRVLKDWRLLEQTGTGLQVYHEGEPPLTIGDMATINRNRHGKLLNRPEKALTTVGMDISYGEGISPGGHKYALTLVDLATKHTWVYGLRTKSAECVIDALWSFFIDASGIPQRIRCDFDSSFVKGKVYSFL